MTYVIAWQNERSVFLSGDSILTSTFDLNPNEDQTAFGEKLKKEAKDSHSEACLKIWVIDNLAVGLASNDVYEAVEFLKVLNEKLDSKNIEKSINEALKLNPPKESTFLFAFHETENKLLRYDPDYEDLIPEHDPIQIGSIPEQYRDQSYDFCDYLIEESQNLSDADSLVLINTIHQNTLVVQRALEFDAGGLFTGLYLNKDGLFWQKDTVYINYTGDLDKLNSGFKLEEYFYPLGMIQLINRNNCASFTSGLNNKTSKTGHLFRCWVSIDENDIPDFIIDEKQQWRNNYYEEIFKLFECPKPKYICLFSNDVKFSGNLIVIRSNNGNPFISISCLESNEFEIILNRGVIKALKPDGSNKIYKYKIVN